MLPSFIKGLIRSEKPNPQSQADEIDNQKSGTLVFQSAEQLLTPHLSKVESIYQTLSISRDHFKKLYMPLIENLAFLLQQIPASENHHHAYLGGLLEHSLEVSVFAARLRQGVMIRGVAEDQMAIVSEALSYAIITAALLHDVGKVVTDVQIANLSKNNTFLPLIDEPKVGEKYAFRFRKERAYTDHQKANLQLSLKLMPDNGIRWLSKYTEIYQHWCRTLGGEYSDAGDIGRIVARADSTSTQRATISHAATGDSASHNPLSKLTPADTFVRILRSMMETQLDSLPLNKRGAVAWVTKDYIYFVSKRIIDEVKRAAERLGPSVNLPSDNSAIMTALGDAKKVKLNEGRAIHKITIKEGDWEVKMTFLVFAREQIDPAGNLPVTKSTLIDESGELLHSAESESSTSAKQESVEQAPESSHQEKTDSMPPEVVQPKQTIQPPQDENITLGEYEGADNSFFSSYSGPEVPDEPPGLEGIAPQRPPVESNPAVMKPQPGPEPKSGSKKEMGLHFTNWLKNYVTLNIDAINGPSSALHIAEPGLLVMITPAIFGKYLDDNQAIYKNALSEGQDNALTRRGLIKKIQFSVETQLSYMSSFGGQKIIKIKVTGNRHSGVINGYILDEDSTATVFGSVPLPSFNPHISILTPLM